MTARNIHVTVIGNAKKRPCNFYNLIQIIMKRNCIVLIIVIIIVFFTACEKDENTSSPIQIVTSKRHYISHENIIIEVSNVSDSVARYYICSSYEGISPLIDRLEEDSWTSYWSPICDGYISHCCGELQAGDLYRDTLKIDFDPGYYRVEYQFIVRPSHEYESYYSNKFQVE